MTFKNTINKDKSTGSLASCRYRISTSVFQENKRISTSVFQENKKMVSEIQIIKG
jgi:prephenate dehydrogenase